MDRPLQGFVSAQYGGGARPLKALLRRAGKTNQ
jgi:hypothetical protein